MDDPHLEVLRRWMTPAELEQIRKAQGDPDEIIERTKRVDRIVARDKLREEIWKFLGRALVAFATVMGALATVKAILPAGWWP